MKHLRIKMRFGKNTDVNYKAPLTTTKENGSPSKTLTMQGGTKTLPPSQSDKVTKTEGSSPSAIT